MIVTLVVIFGLAALILGHEAGHFFSAKLFKMKIDEFGFGFPPKIFGRKKGDTEYSLNWLPFGGFVRIAGENDRVLGDEAKLNSLPEEEKKKLFSFRPTWQRSIVILAGVAMNIILGWFLISTVFMIGSDRAVMIDSVQAGSPAEQAGLKGGDILQGYFDTESFTLFTSEHRGQEVGFTILRDGEEHAITTTLRAGTDAQEGALGVAIAEVGFDREPPLRALWVGAEVTYAITKGTIVGFLGIFKNLIVHGSVPSEVVGPVGIFSVAKTAGNAGITPFIQLLAIISINLAVLNLLPFPALDGGRFLIILIEKAKGAPISRKVEGAINGIGFAFLIFLMALVTARDVFRLF